MSSVATRPRLSVANAFCLASSLFPVIADLIGNLTPFAVAGVIKTLDLRHYTF